MHFIIYLQDKTIHSDDGTMNIKINNIVGNFLTLSKFIKLLNGLWAVPYLMLFRHFSAWIGIRIVCIRADRIGHFPADSAEAICRAEKMNDWRVYCLQGKPVNNQWYKMLKKKLRFCNPLFYLYFYEKRLFRKMILCENATLHASRDIEGKFATTTFSQLSFDADDQEKAYEWMLSQGIKQGDKFICLLVRDNAYMKAHSTSKNQDFSYHNYRDSEIATYEKGIMHLLNEGYWVIRMGRKTNQPLNINHHRWIDYSQNPSIQSDLMDVWLFSQCNGCISTSSGPDIISAIYNRPLCFINFVPVSHHWSFVRSVTAPKKLIYKDSKISLTWHEMITHSYMHAIQYEENGIEVVDLSSDEIREAFDEFCQMMKGPIKQSKKLLDMERCFIKQLKEHPKSSSLHGWWHPESKLSSFFLQNHIDLQNMKRSS